MGIVVFDERNGSTYADAMRCVQAGGQALHVWMPPREGYPDAPEVFKRAQRNGEPWAHLLDKDKERLVKTVRRYGVRVVAVYRAGTPTQHVDLCGDPLRRILKEAQDGQLSLLDNPT